MYVLEMFRLPTYSFLMARRDDDPTYGKPKSTPHDFEGSVRLHPDSLKGRGAISNTSGRYERESRERIDDGWGAMDEAPPVLRTNLTWETARTIISWNDSPDIPFDRSINPYRGCEHGCIYCYARPSHAYYGLSAGVDFESRIFSKRDAAALLRNELRNPRYKVEPMALGSNTDPWQPLEKIHGVTREILQVLSDFNHPVGIVTKSALIARDIDILSSMAERNLVRVFVSVTTLDRNLARKMEPRAATPERRIDTIAALAAAGIPTGVMTAPMIPALNDHEMEAILERAKDAGAQSAGYVLLRLPWEIKDLWREWTETHFPDRAARIMSHIRASHGGKDYDADFGKRMKGEGVYATLIAQRFQNATKRLGLNQQRMPLDRSRFAAPIEPGDQMRLF